MAEGWHRHIDAYCERTDPSFWSEPLNAVTNASFLIAFYVAYRAWRRDEDKDWAVLVLLVLMVAIGIGSFLFHTFATFWAMLADVIPITLFIIFYLVMALRRFFGCAWWQALLIGAIFLRLSGVVASDIDALVPVALYGSQGYVPALAALLICGFWLRGLGRPAGNALLVGAGIFTVSLTFRTLDQPLCEAFPIGTHLFWHLLNGVLLGWLTLAMLRHGRPQARSG
ncbi:MAG: hypothetical protein EA356_12030 [Geminicoccaceae bacterium]|nr:MAG: hypothetical protein EA356_12030 [Geminicoccaceae bacterium]